MTEKKEWQKWETELLEFYTTQPTTIGIIASLLSRTKDEVREKLDSMNKNNLRV